MADLNLEILFRAVDEMSSVLGKIGGEVSTLGTRAQQLGERMSSMGKSMIISGAAMAAPAAAVGVAMYDTIKEAGEMEGAMAHVATAMNDGALQTKHLAEVQEFAENLAEKSVISTKELAQAYYIARSNGADHARALEAVAAAANLVTGTTANAAEAQASMVDTTRTLTGLSNIYHVSLGSLADQLSLLQTRYAFKNISEITAAIKYAASTAEGAHVPLQTMSAAIAVLSQNMLIGGQAGQTLRQLMITFEEGGSKGKLAPFIKHDVQGNFLLKESFQALHDSIAKMTPVQQGMFLAHAGFQARTLAGAQVMLQNLGKVSDIEADMSSKEAIGASGKAAQTRLAAFDEMVAQLGNSWEVLKEKIGEALLPVVKKLIPQLQAGVMQMIEFVRAGRLQPLINEFRDFVSTLTAVVGWFIRLAANHPGIASLAVKIGGVGVALSGLAGIAAIATGGLLTVGGAALQIGGGVLHVITYLSSLAGGFDLVTIATSALDVAMLPMIVTIGAIVAVVGLLALAAYEVIKHWDVVEPFLSRVINGIKLLFTHPIEWFKTVGLKWMEALGQGILEAAELPYKAGVAVAEKIGKLFHFHSPPVEGPLRDALLNFRLGEELAKRMNPTAVMRPAYAMAGAMAGAVGGGRMGNGGIVINLNYSVNGSTPQDFDPRKHADHIVRIIRDRLDREQRLRFE